MRWVTSRSMSERSPIGRARVQAFLIGFAVACAIVFSAGVVLAAGGEHKSDSEVMKETIFQGINLLILLGVLFYAGRKPISEYFAARRDGIQNELNEAAELLAEAERRNAELQRRLVDLSSETEEISENAGRRAGEEAERILADARAAAERIRRDAQAAIDQELRRAKTELREEAADLALEIAGRKLADQVTDGDRERLMDEFIIRVEPSSAGMGGSGSPHSRPQGGEGAGQ